jgi:hypothetical protein
MRAFLGGLVALHFRQRHFQLLVHGNVHVAIQLDEICKEQQGAF